MPRRLYPPPHPQSIGEVIDSGFRIFYVSLLRCLPYGVLSMLAGQLQNIYDLALGRAPRGLGANDPVWWLLFALGSVIGVALWSAVLIRQRAIASGEATTYATELRAVARTLHRILLLGVLVAAAMGVTLALAAAVPALLVPDDAEDWRALLPPVLMLVPVAYVGIRLLPAWPALVLDGHGPLAALRHGWQLVSGSWWRTLIVLVVALAMVFVVYAFAGVLAILVMQLSGATDVAVVTAVSTVVVVALGAVGTPFYCGVLLAMYGDLRLRSEGLDIERRLAELARNE